MDNNNTQPNETDELPSTRMSFGAHIEELRRRLLRSIFGLIIAFAVCLIFGGRIIGFLAEPLLLALQASGLPTQLYAASMPETFIIYIKVSLYSGIFLASPWIFYQIWGFVAAGLYPRERRYVHFFVPFAAALFILGGLFFLLVVAPLSCNFFIKFNNKIIAPQLSDSFFLPLPSDTQPPPDQPVPPTDQLPVTTPAPPQGPQTPQSLVRPWFTLRSYISLILVLALAFSLAFQVPLVVFFLGRLGLVTIATFRSVRKYVLFGIVILSALMTPPDVVTQIALSLPMYLLYECGIIMLRFLPRRKLLE